jgi:hypothetical protein
VASELPPGLRAADERRHRPGAGPLWSELWQVDWWAANGSAGGTSCHVLLPNVGRAWYWAALVRPDGPLLSVVDLDQPLPVGTLRLRGGSLWADLVCEAPFGQWTVMNETYAVALDDPAEALGRSYGDPVPVAFDWEWYAEALPVRGAPPGCEGYRVEGEVHGEVELRGGSIAVSAPGRLTHWWGERAWFTSEGEPAHGSAAPVRLRGPAGEEAALHRVLTRHGWHEWLRPLG